ncbi:MAG: DUF2344 domain-containing protein [Lachnospiraceae bacterium]|nr:DUF2344 domain-containing protein [Lachnospiraceae bacterium]
MKLRIKFSKTGDIKYTGHLDLMRFFQKLNRRAKLDLKYSQGFSPHQIMAFAQPLGVGVESIGEYVDIEVNDVDCSSEELARRMNEVSVPELKILQVKRLPDDAKNAMASVQGALYKVSFKQGKAPETSIDDKIDAFLKKDEILITKESKNGERSVDIKPGIYEFKTNGDGSYNMLLNASSSGNIKPVQVFEAFLSMQGESLKDNALAILRLDTYEADNNGNLISMGDIGETF